ncbi:DUF2845 domain-containing protein [Cellvibrio japonicus]|uniref:Putative lipoprotein n=1 Tax=Cellvibrio japonicus (strain Ueda107) TaxID=498211 RepID=B3PEX3_CELJU|nr:DUF2845 domain-containing protein [Cellvibrio japonicus]ACE83661.1 putative lipoprotein [Cellvibrio japonicus Ueda107]QEI12220.1 DUF2845 domain-containing protein [Cellvibrio japonicus]QEI15794.1 DUF2845 domain-containing protein [Cellvibrio japonicus]QEI19372.1 DUF2845 domain-containing protein [Cellvibrio japonicus]
MLRTSLYPLLPLALISISLGCQADTLRCGTKVTQTGDTKAEVIAKCGDPVFTDHYCAPMTTNLQIQATQQGDNNIQNNIAIQSCQDVDIWTYEPGKGKFIQHLYFTEGRLRRIERGDRVD